MDDLKDCLSCSNSGVTKDDELWCSLKQKIVTENESCEDHN